MVPTLPLCPIPHSFPGFITSSTILHRSSCPPIPLSADLNGSLNSSMLSLAGLSWLSHLKALCHLPSIPPSYEIEFFSAGEFNKLYLLHPFGDANGSRIVDPYFKTGSEVATLKFVEKNTLMTKLPGVPLESLWESPNLVWDSRVEITKALARYVKQLRNFKFPLMGNLYP
jgi:hypothetical protein